MDELIEELKVKIISTLSLLDVRPEDIKKTNLEGDRSTRSTSWNWSSC